MQRLRSGACCRRSARRCPCAAPPTLVAITALALSSLTKLTRTPPGSCPQVIQQSVPHLSAASLAYSPSAASRAASRAAPPQPPQLTATSRQSRAAGRSSSASAMHHRSSAGWRSRACTPQACAACSLAPRTTAPAPRPRAPAPRPPPAARPAERLGGGPGGKAGGGDVEDRPSSRHPAAPSALTSTTAPPTATRCNHPPPAPRPAA